MNTKTITSVLLITLSLVVLACSRFSFMTQGKPTEFAGMHGLTTDSHFIAPAVGALMLIGVMVLAVRGPQESVMNEANLPVIAEFLQAFP